jgi:hypothetical protein
MNLTEALYDRLSTDSTLITLLADYNGGPAVFTTDPAPGNAHLPYLVSAGEVAQTPFDTKTGRGRRVWRDVRCYAAADGSAATVEAIAERVRALLHRQALTVDGFVVLIESCAGPVSVDEPDVYGRIVTVELLLTEV